MDENEEKEESFNSENQITGKAEVAVWNLLRKILESNGEHEAVLYLNHLLKAVHHSTKSKGKYQTVDFKMYQRFSDYNTQFNANTGELISWYFEKLREKSIKKIPVSECLSIATKIALPPDEAVLSEAQYEKAGNEIVFIARWCHFHNKIQVEGDFIQISINGETGNPFSYHRKWHEIDEEYTER